MDSNTLSAIWGVAASLFFSYVPGVKTWFDGLDTTMKRLVMGVALVLIAVSVYGLSCTSSPIVSGVSCDESGAWSLVSAVISALVANQAMFLLTPEKK